MIITEGLKGTSHHGRYNEYTLSVQLIGCGHTTYPTMVGTKCTLPGYSQYGGFKSNTLRVQLTRNA